MHTHYSYMRFQFLTGPRIRHKKCDERLPSCLPCVTTGRKCDFQSLIPQGQSINRNSINLRTNHLSIVPLNPSDSPHFDYFFNVCAKEFSLYFESPVWESIVWRAACTEPCIRHTSLAIGAMSRNNYQHSGHLSDHLPVLEYSMGQYNLALRALNNTLDQSARSLELAILGSIVFISLEVLLGVDNRVQMHINGAFAMLENLLGRGVNGEYYSNVALERATDLGYLVSALTGLGRQFSSFQCH